jgi:hypothetical protein
MVVQALYQTPKVLCNGSANKKNLKKWRGKHFAAPTLTDWLMTNH